MVRIWKPNGGIDLMADTLSNELDSLNINESQQVKSNDPNTWNPLELPKPVDPTTLNTSASEKTNRTGNKKTAPVTSSPLADNSNKLKKLANSNGMNSNSQTKPLAKVQHPVYLEVCYIPTHGNGHYSDMEFFRRVRSRHYILSTQEPSEDVLNALIKAKETWKKSLHVSIIPTYESELLRRWFEQNE
jgi:microtubule-associated protein 1